MRVRPDVTFKEPTWIGYAPDDPARRYVMERAGRVYVLDLDGGARALFADLRDPVYSEGFPEEGLLSLAFHPRYAENHRVFLFYTAKKPLRCVLVEMRSSGGRLDPTTARVLLQYEKAYENHNGGDVRFGPDGLLYLSTGDGGGGGDPDGNGQNTRTLLGKILRIDVDHGDPYAIPPDNPYADGRLGRPEIYAIGLRNPWRTTFDGDRLWTSDVGQDLWEEVDRIEKGGNYGWNVREGRTCFGADRCDSTGLIDPVFVYGRDQGISVTGGHVYRGSLIPTLQGAYVLGDFGSGRLFAVCAQGSDPPSHATIAAESGVNPSTFALEPDGEILLADYGKGGLWRLAGCP